MEKINHLIKKISEINSQNTNIHILDIDMMMDYTRTLYATLLDKRAQLLASGINISTSKNLSENSDEKSSTKENLDSNTIETSDAPPHSETDLSSTTYNIVPLPQGQVLPLEEIPLGKDREEEEIEIENPKIIPVEDISDKNEEAPQEAIIPSKTEVIEEIQTPETKEISNSVLETAESLQPSVNQTEIQTIEVDTQSEPVNIDEEKNIPLTAENETASTEEKPIHETKVAQEETALNLKNEISFDHQNLDFKEIEIEKSEPSEHKIITEINLELPVIEPNKIPKIEPSIILKKLKSKDIRSFIGINDKYQFTNELFGNNKEAYEKTLDKISGFDNLMSAHNWLNETACKAYNWDVKDETFLELLTVTQKYFAD